MRKQKAEITMIGGGVFTYLGKEGEDVTSSINGSIVGTNLASLLVVDSGGKSARIVGRNIVSFVVSFE